MRIESLGVPDENDIEFVEFRTTAPGTIMAWCVTQRGNMSYGGTEFLVTLCDQVFPLELLDLDMIMTSTCQTILI